MRTTHLNRRRSTALLSAAALVASGILATTGASNAAVTASGGENADGTPTFVRDAQGVALALCTDANANLCEPAVDDHIGVYFAAEANTGPLRATFGVEAVENADNPAGAPLVSNGARFDLEGLRPNTRYTIKDPWGTTSVRTDATGGRSFRMETNGRVENLKNGHVTTFLHTLGRQSSEFVGNANVTSRVFGSPTGFNAVRITAPNGRSWSTRRFSLMGQKRDNTAMSKINRTSLTMGNGQTADVVQRTIRYASFGTANARPTFRKAGQNPAAFSVRDTCGAEAPGTGCDVVVTFRPRQNVNSTKRAVLVINDNSMAAPRRVSLTGVGVRR